MKYVINTTYGLFRLPEEYAREQNREDIWDYNESDRADPALISWVEAHPECDLCVVEIPARATDWELDEYDGLESIIAVVDGKLVHLY